MWRFELAHLVKIRCPVCRQILLRAQPREPRDRIGVDGGGPRVGRKRRCQIVQARIVLGTDEPVAEGSPAA